MRGVGRGGVERVDQLGDAIFAGDRTAAQRRERIARGRLLDDRAAEIEPQRALARAVLIGARRQRRVERAEEDQHQDEDEPVLDPDQQPPRLADEPHLNRSLMIGANRHPQRCKWRARAAREKAARPLTRDEQPLNQPALALGYTGVLTALQTHFEKGQRMKFRPLHDRVLVRRVEAEEKTAGGIIIPDTAQEKPQEGEVISVGTGTRAEDGTVTPLDVKAGDKILFGKWSGTEVKIDGEDLIIMKESDILGIVG